MRWFAPLCVTVLLLPLVFVSGAGGAPGTAPPLAALLARHVPILVLHPEERFQPVPVEGFLADSDLQRRTASGWETIGGGAVPADGADLRLDQRSCRAVEGTAASPCYAQAEAAHGAAPVVYGAAFRTHTRIDLEYWLWYPYDDYSPTIPPGDVWQVHEGDWESVSVVLDLAGKPRFVALSQHCEGARRAWAGVRKKGQRPIVFVGLGSHANYFGPGSFPHSVTCWPPELRDVVRALKLVDHAETGRTVRPRLIPVSATRPAWMLFSGRWGEDAYVHFPNNDPVAYQGSPQGPAFHDEWRRPVVEALSWPRG